MQISLGRKVLFSAVLVLGALLLCEAALRVRAYIRYGTLGMSVRDPMIHFDEAADLFVPTPGYRIQGNQVNISINSLGFRGDEFTREKPHNTVRIAVLGASTTFNAEVSSNHATWPHRLQETLRAAHPGLGIEVINASLGGYVSSDNLKSLRHRVLPLEPDLVIYYEANNEIVRDTRELAMQQGLIADGGRPPRIVELARYSLMFDLAYKNLAILVRGRSESGRKMDNVPTELPRRFIQTLDEMRQELDRKGIPFMVSTFIVKYRRDQERSLQIANADVAFYYMPWMSIDGLLSAMDVYNQAILDFAASRRLHVVDDRYAIPPTAEYFTDCMHLADKGAEAMAARFHRYFEKHRIVEQLVGAATVSPAVTQGGESR